MLIPVLKYIAASSLFFKISKFSAFFSSAAFVKLNCGDYNFFVDNHYLVVSDCVFGINIGGNTGIIKNVADVYLSFFWLLSRIASTLIPRLCASTKLWQ